MSLTILVVIVNADACEGFVVCMWLLRDTAGQERFETLTAQYYRRAQVRQRRAQVTCGAGDRNG